MASETKVAVVTGASRGIGKAISIELAKNGFDIAVTARSVEEKSVTPWPGTIHETAAEVRKLGRKALPIKLDLNSKDDIRSAIDRTMKEFGRIDVMVNNSRWIGKSHWTKLVDSDWDEMEQILNVNVRALWLTHYLCVPIMIKQGGGLFINITSEVAFKESPHLPGHGWMSFTYPVTKAAMNRLAPALAKEVREHNIAIVSLDPGFTLTERVEEETAGYGMDLSQTHSVWVPAKAAAYIATCPNPLAFSGQYFNVKDLVQELGLMTEKEMASPWQKGRTSDWTPAFLPLSTP